MIIRRGPSNCLFACNLRFFSLYTFTSSKLPCSVLSGGRYKEERGLTLASVWGSEPVGEQDIQFRECLMLDFLSGDPILSLARVPSILLRCHQEEERGGSAMGTEQFPRIFPLR